VQSTELSMSRHGTFSHNKKRGGEVLTLFFSFHEQKWNRGRSLAKTKEKSEIPRTRRGTTRSTRSCFASQRVPPTLDVRFLHFFFIYFFLLLAKLPLLASQRAPHTLGVCSHRGAKKEGKRRGQKIKKALIFVVALCRGLANVHS
jgi:hypothetical protein